MNEVEQEIRYGLRSASAHLTMPPDAAANAWQRAARRTRRDRAFTAIAVMVVVAGVAATLLTRVAPVDTIASPGPTPSVTKSLPGQPVTWSWLPTGTRDGVPVDPNTLLGTITAVYWDPVSGASGGINTLRLMAAYSATHPDTQVLLLAMVKSPQTQELLDQVDLSGVTIFQGVLKPMLPTYLRTLPFPFAATTDASGRVTNLVVGRDQVTGLLTGSGTGTLAGHLYRVGGPAPGATTPVTAGTVTFTGAGGYQDSRDVDANGAFTITLPADTYQVTVHSPQNGSSQPTCQPTTPLTVAANNTTKADVTCPIR